MLSTSFPRIPWFFLQVVTIIAISSYLSSNSKELSKFPKVFMTDPSNWWSNKLFSRKVGFQMRYPKFLGISVTSLPVSIGISKSKLLILTFSSVMVIVAGIGHGDTRSNPGLIAFHIALIPLGNV